MLKAQLRRVGYVDDVIDLNVAPEPAYLATLTAQRLHGQMLTAHPPNRQHKLGLPWRSVGLWRWVFGASSRARAPIAGTSA